ncbi:hypothetical protein GJV06_08555 [Enterobacteriaceae bacterium RIT691]|nr:hypothetical protein [Enterobacteriaceae bacterium RIT691]
MVIQTVEHYPSTDAEKAHAEALKKKHDKAQRGMGEFDQGRIHAAIYTVAMLRELGEKKAADKVEHFLNWLAGHDVEKAVLSGGK